MDIYKYTAGGHNIVKFDFPRINLLDSSHHGLADGMLVYTINTWPGLPLGTIIPNRAGIYFDDNDVVMTNTVNNIIATPPVALGSQVLQKDKVVLYPNPASDELTVRATSGTFRSYTITNELGQVVKKGDINGNATSVHVWELPAGLYIVSLRGDTEATKLMFVKN